MKNASEFLSQPELLHKDHTEAQLGFNFWTIYPNVRFGKRIRLGSYVVIENDCELDDDVLIGNGAIIRGGTKIGARTRIGHLCVLEGGGIEIGEDCLLQPLGFFSRGCKIGNGCFIGPHFTSSSDLRLSHMRLDVLPYKEAPPIIGDYVRIASCVTVTPGIVIESNCLIGDKSLVMRDIPACKKAIGNPARILGDVAEDELKGVIDE